MSIAFQVDPVGPCKKKIAVTIPAERIQQEFDSKYNEINEHVALKGFRPGHAPRKLLEKRFAGKLGDEVKGDLVKAALEELVEEQKVEPLKPPEIDIESLEMTPDQELSFEFELITKPEFDTPEYKGLEVKVPPVVVTDAQVDQGVENLLRGSAQLETVEDAVVTDDDLLIIDWEAKDGDSVEAKDSNFWYQFGRGVVGGFVAEGVDDQLRGKKVGATASATVQVAADDAREELRDKELTLEIELKEVKRYVLPEIDAAFLEANDYDDEDELREDVSKQIQRAMRREVERGAELRLVDQLLETVDISLPEEFVEGELEGWAGRKRLELQMEKVAEEEIAKQVDAGRDDARTSIEADMRRFFLLDRLATEEAVEVTEAEMLQAVNEIAQAYGRPVEEVIGSLQHGGRLGELSTQIRHRKAREAVRGAATLVEDESLLSEEEKAKPKKAAKKKASKKKAAKKKKSAKKKAD